MTLFPLAAVLLRNLCRQKNKLLIDANEFEARIRRRAMGADSSGTVELTFEMRMRCAVCNIVKGRVRNNSVEIYGFVSGIDPDKATVQCMFS